MTGASRSTSWTRSMRACAASAPTTSTSTRCTARPEDADRRDVARARRHRPRRQGALHRLLELHRLAARRGAVDRAQTSTWRPSSPRRTSTTCSTGASNASSCRRLRDASARHPALLPAGERLPHRQVPRRRAAARGHPPRDAGPIADRLLTDENYASSASSRPSPKPRGHTWSSSRSAGSPASPTSAASSPARPPEQVEENAHAADWRLTPEEMAEVDALSPAKRVVGWRRSEVGGRSQPAAVTATSVRKAAGAIPLRPPDGDSRARASIGGAVQNRCPSPSRGSGCAAKWLQNISTPKNSSV